MTSAIGLSIAVGDELAGTPVVRVDLLPGSACDVRHRTDEVSVGFAFETQRGEHVFDSDRTSDFCRLLARRPRATRPRVTPADAGEALADQRRIDDGLWR